MIIGTCTVELVMFEPNSLKEKRHIIKSLIGRLQSRFNASIAEIDLQEKWKSAVIGVACVTTTTKHANQMIDNIIKFIEGDNRVEIVQLHIEIL
ncbi:DUF503 domain-containing protein [Geosporobacter ferrireducens]|uniref:DUF503 domain-containing protein n=1 Tax=Geosporobacter ferrireducens TaxID=1424294 RepID=A0A1D8GN35_9FIRM|nr:DUF503 domain-containing protein [Geosporobacter ferrireducens]AOT72366.1 hypothetical protein Gferi_24140 [Geosporobacter ferrireducens]MTI56378.1 DUF503 domain-containing protein [Geosporobacter ferrireducens]